MTLTAPSTEPAVQTRPPAPVATGTPSWPRRLIRGRAEDPVWVRPALFTLLAATAVLYLWNLSASGWANEFYGAAVQAGTKSWKAMFFGSLDAGNVITVDKPAASLWPMVIAARIFGFNSWTLLAPQALEGVAAVGLLYAMVRRVSAPAWGLLAGTILALTPVAALMFRFDNPDALLTLLLVGAGYTLTRALQDGRTHWMVWTGALVGLGFITEMGQAILVVPAFALAYLLFGPVGLWRRLGQLLTAAIAMVVGAGWWIAIVELWPASSRPYIGGSTTNSILELALGYNGLGRLLGNSAGNGGGGASFAGSAGWARLFNSQMAGEIAWLLPTAAIALVAGLVYSARAPRTDARRALLVASGLALIVTGATFSFMSGTIHPYYAVALAPWIGAVIALACSLLWERRSSLIARGVAALMTAVAVLFGVHLLATYAPAFLPWLRPTIVVLAAVGVVGLLYAPWLRRYAVVGLAAALIAGLGGSAAFAVGTAATAHSGSMPSSGPAGTSQQSGFGGGQLGGRTGGTDSQSSNSALVALLAKTTTTWAAAASGSMSAAPLQLASGRPVISIGGFNGGDSAPTLAQFKQWVAEGQISYYVASGQGMGGGPGGSNGAGSAIATWVTQNFTATTVGGVTVYNLTTASK